MEYCETWTPYTYWVKEIKEVVVHQGGYGAPQNSYAPPAGGYVPPPPVYGVPPVYAAPPTPGMV